MAEPIELVLPIPPTVNTYYRHVTKGPMAGRTLISERGRRYRTAVGEIVRSRPRGTAVEHGRLAVSIEFRAPDRRKRDLDNLTKAVLDALTHAGIWADDSQIDDLRIWRSEHLTGEIIVRVTPIAPARGGSNYD
jgi:crossover junction endodeoxyribonuclease RusA